MEHLDTETAIDLTPLAAGSVVSGTPATGTRALGSVAGARVGVWEISEGVSTDVEVDEVFVVLSGRATVAAEDGTELEVGPGSAVRLHAGDRTTWTVHERLRKLYVV